MIFYMTIGVSTLRTHPHPHFLLSPPQPHHPYTPHLCRSMKGPLGEEYHPAERCDPEEGLNCTEADFPRTRLDTAKVKWVLPSRKSARQDG